MRVYDNGKYRNATEAEIAEMERTAAEMPVPEPTPEERMDAMEEALLELGMLLGGGL
jgi:hypothetical protein